MLRGRGIRGEGLEKNELWELGQKQEAFRERGQAVFRFFGVKCKAFSRHFSFFLSRDGHDFARGKNS